MTPFSEKEFALGKKEENYLFSVTFITIVKRGGGGGWTVSGTIECLYIIIILWLLLTSLCHFTPTLRIFWKVFFYPHLRPQPSNGQNVRTPPAPSPGLAKLTARILRTQAIYFMFFFLFFSRWSLLTFPNRLKLGSWKKAADAESSAGRLKCLDEASRCADLIPGFKRSNLCFECLCSRRARSAGWRRDAEAECRSPPGYNRSSPT